MQYAAPAAVSAHTFEDPTSRSAKVNPPDTATGTLLVVVAPLPSCPFSPSPQQ